MNSQHSSKDIDRMLVWLRSVAPAVMTITPRQLDMIKSNWKMLHEYDTEHEYTISEDGTRLRKDLRSVNTKPKKVKK